MSIASRLTERVRIEQQTLTDDGYGGKTALGFGFHLVQDLHVGKFRGRAQG